ncbi:MAG: hypothetical protein Q8N55_01820, partial [bacterium]|nr:hypothetical protein [bacterium]
IFFMEIIGTISIAANIVFVSWGVRDFFANRRINIENANFLNGVYEMAERLSKESNNKFAAQSKNISSAVLSVAMNFMGLRRNEIRKSSKENKRRRGLLFF